MPWQPQALASKKSTAGHRNHFLPTINLSGIAAVPKGMTVCWTFEWVIVSSPLNCIDGFWDGFNAHILVSGFIQFKQDNFTQKASESQSDSIRRNGSVVPLRKHSVQWLSLVSNPQYAFLFTILYCDTICVPAHSLLTDWLKTVFC